MNQILNITSNLYLLTGKLCGICAIFQNGFEVLPSNAQIVLDGRRMYLHEVTLPNEGIYQCRVRNSAGQSTKNFALSVLGITLLI